MQERVYTIEKNIVYTCGNGSINQTSLEILHTDYTHLDGSVIGKVVEPGPA
jgi:hypothetical protein